MLSNNYRSAYDVSSETAPILKHLLCDKQNQNLFHPFIYETFNLFLNKKTNITLNMWGIHYHVIENKGMMGWHSRLDSNFLKLIFGGTGATRFTRGENNKDPYFIPSDDTNIPIIFTKFNHLHTLTIFDTQYYFGNTYYSMSLFSLLNLLTPQSTIKEIKIYSQRDDESETKHLNWISFVFARDCIELTQKYRERGYIIDYGIEDYGDCIRINKV